MSERRGELEEHQQRLKRELALRRRAVKARAYEDAIRRLKQAASDFAREVEATEGPAFFAGVLHALAGLPRMLDGDMPARLRKVDGTPPPQLTEPGGVGGSLDELVIDELTDPRWRDR